MLVSVGSRWCQECLDLGTAVVVTPIDWVRRDVAAATNVQKHEIADASYAYERACANQRWMICVSRERWASKLILHTSQYRQHECMPEPEDHGGPVVVGLRRIVIRIVQDPLYGRTDEQKHLRPCKTDRLADAIDRIRYRRVDVCGRDWRCGIGWHICTVTVVVRNCQDKEVLNLVVTFLCYLLRVTAHTHTYPCVRTALGI